MTPRILETVLTGRNLLSPVLREGARDVREYNAAVEQGNARAGTSATQAAQQQQQSAQRVVQANRQVNESVGATTATYQRSASALRERLGLQEREGAAAQRSAADNRSAAASASAFAQAIEDGNLRIGRSAEQSAADMAALRSRIVDLGQNRISPDVDTTDARMQLAELRTVLDDIASDDPSARVRAETDQAEAQLRTLQARLNSIDGQRVTATVDVDDHGSIARAHNGMSALGMTALAIGPTLGSLGAVATAGLGAIGPLAAGGVAGLGALALGVSGVSDAVKLLEQRQTTQATEAAQAAATQGAAMAQQATAARQVESAQAGLANARANAADSAIRSASAVASASANVQQAEQSAARSVADAARKRSDAYADAAREQQQSQRDIRNAVEQAAAGVNSALRTQEQAEKSLGSAQRDARQAQTDLTDARKSAQQQIEDTAMSVQDNALAQREAVFDLRDAQRELDEARASGDAETVARAEIALARQEQRGNQLLVQGRRLADQQAENDRTGVDGSRQVVAAQQRIVDSNEAVSQAQRAAAEASAAVTGARADGAERVALAEQAAADSRSRSQRSIADAEEGLTRARQDGARKVTDAQRAVSEAVRDQASQQRQSAYSVEQAQAGVTAALAAVQAASVAAGGAGSAALASIDAKLAEVGPSTRRFADFVQDRLKPAVTGMQESAAAGLLPGVQAGLEHLMPYLPQVNNFVGKIGDSAGRMAERTGAALTNPFWTDFFSMIDRTAVPSMENLFGSAGNVAHGFAGILMAFEPMSMQLGDGIEDLTGRFARWGENLADNPDFHRFTDYVQDQWPKVSAIVGNVADMVGDLVEAGIPIGSAYLTGFQLLTEVLSGLPVGVVQALLIAFLGYKSVSGVASIINGVARSFDAISIAAGRVGVDKLTGIAGGIRGVGAASGSAAGGVGRFSGAASGMLGVLGGPWGAGLAVAGVGVGLLVRDLEKATQRGKDWAEALRDGGRAAAEARAEMDQTRSNVLGDLDDGNGFWGGIKLGVRSAFGVDELGEQARALNAASEASRAYWNSLSPLQQAQAKSAEWSRTLNERLQDENATTADLEAAKRRYAHWTGEEARMQGELDAALGVTSESLSTQGTVIENMVGAAGEQLGIYQQLLADKTVKEQEAAQAAAIANGDASQSWRDHVASASVSMQEYAAALDADVVKHDEHRADIKAVTERGGVEVGAALLAMGEEGARIADEMANATDADFFRMAESMVNHARNGGARANWEIDQAMKIMTLASREGTKLTAQAIADELGIGVADAARIAGNYGVVVADNINPLLNSLGKPNIDVSALSRGLGLAGRIVGKADGGVIEGPYIGPKADNVLIRANPREFMQPVAAVEHYGVDFMEAVRHRRIPKDVIAGYADGGLIALGREFQQRGARVTGHSAFGGREYGGHGRTSKHYTDDALDVNTRAGTSALEQRELAPLMALARTRGFRTIFMSAGHFNHGHVDNGAGGSIGGGSVGAAVPQTIQLPRPPSTAPFQAPISTAADAVMQHVYDNAQAWVDANTAVLDSPSENGDFSGAGVERWRGTVLQALGRTRQPQGHAGSTLRRMNQESGGNPRAINNWDVNAKRGTPSKGLMQVIDPTFAANRDRGLPNDIWDPLANITASMNYALKRYGSLPAAYDRKGGYDEGGVANGAGYLPKYTPEPERVLSPQQTVAFERWMDSPAAMPGYGTGASLGGGAGRIAITVQSGPVQLFVDGQEFRGMARIEAETVVVQAEALREELGAYSG